MNQMVLPEMVAFLLLPFLHSGSAKHTIVLAHRAEKVSFGRRLCHFRRGGPDTVVCQIVGPPTVDKKI